MTVREPDAIRAASSASDSVARRSSPPSQGALKSLSRQKSSRVFYALGAPGDIIRAHRCRIIDRLYDNQMTLPFSSQAEDYFEAANAVALMTSTVNDGRTHRDGAVEFRHVGKPSRAGVRYHLGEISYGLRLLNLARKFKATIAFVESGATHYFMLLGFRLIGIPVVPVLHNTLWPNGFAPTGLKARALYYLDGFFWRMGPIAVLAVSPAIARQVRETAPGGRYPVMQVRAQFNPNYFAGVAPAPPHDTRPFRVIFAGRITEDKGVLDIVRMAEHAERQAPGLIHWTICGDGPDSERLKHTIMSSEARQVITFTGWTDPTAMKSILEQSHCSIIPTRSDFAEGLAMTAVEAVLAGRPIVSNSVVPAIELLQPACVEADPDSPISHAEAVIALATDPQLYEQKRRACDGLAQDFLSREFGLAEILRQVSDYVATR